MTFEEFQEQYVKNDVEYECFCGFGGDYNKYRKAQEDLFKQALAEERNETFNRILNNVALPKSARELIKEMKKGESYDT